MPKTQIEKDMGLRRRHRRAAVLLLIGYMMFISPQNSKTSSPRSRRRRPQKAVEPAAAGADRRSARPVEEPGASTRRDLQTAELALPTTSGLPDFLRTLQSIGNATLTTVSA